MENALAPSSLLGGPFRSAAPIFIYILNTVRHASRARLGQLAHFPHRNSRHGTKFRASFFSSAFFSLPLLFGRAFFHYLARYSCAPNRGADFRAGRPNPLFFFRGADFGPQGPKIAIKIHRRSA